MIDLICNLNNLEIKYANKYNLLLFNLLLLKLFIKIDLLNVILDWFNRKVNLKNDYIYLINFVNTL